MTTGSLCSITDINNIKVNLLQNQRLNCGREHLQIADFSKKCKVKVKIRQDPQSFCSIFPS